MGRAPCNKTGVNFKAWHSLTQMFQVLTKSPSCGNSPLLWERLGAACTESTSTHQELAVTAFGRARCGGQRELETEVPA